MSLVAYRLTGVFPPWAGSGPAPIAEPSMRLTLHSPSLFPDAGAVVVARHRFCCSWCRSEPCIVTFVEPVQASSRAFKKTPPKTILQTLAFMRGFFV